jgi:hypothetical protein
MRVALIAAALVLVLRVGILRGEDAKPAVLQAKLFRIVATAALPPQAEKLAVSYGQSMEEGFQAFYLVKGAHIIAIDEYSLSLESLMTPEGVDILKKRNESLTYDLGVHWDSVTFDL